MSASQGFLSHGGFECFEIIWVHHNRKEHQYLNVMCTYPWILFPWWHRSCQSFHSCWKHRWLGLSFQRDLWHNQPEKIINILLASHFPSFRQSFFILISDEEIIRYPLIWNQSPHGENFVVGAQFVCENAL